MKRGRPFEPGNKFGRGRPRGSRNKKTLLTQQLLDEHGESIVRKTLVKALEGDSRLLQALLGYLLPRRKDAPLYTSSLRTANVEELSQSLDLILKQACAGDITLSQAQALAAMIEARRQLLEAEDFERRLQILEKAKP
jgi:hypothetical protein